MAIPPKKKTDAVALGDILPSVLRTCRSADADLVRLWDLWPDVAGETVAAHTWPAAFKGGLLVVNAASSVWVHQLQFLKSALVDKINTAMGSAMVSDLRFKVGPLER